jgi:NAD(P)H-dependent flavin oxidoreductase YrpB (nitropropane dioxygenase family)
VLTTRFTRLIGCNVPIQQAGMGGVATAELASAVAWQVGSVEEARAAAGAGCDFLVAQGIEAGGHVRGRIGLLPLLDGVLDCCPFSTECSMQ